MPTHTESEFIGTAEVCKLLHVHQATVGRLVASGDLEPAHKLPGKNGAYVFRRTDVDDLIAKRSAEASA